MVYVVYEFLVLFLCLVLEIFIWLIMSMLFPVRLLDVTFVNVCIHRETLYEMIILVPSTNEAHILGYILHFYSTVSVYIFALRTLDRLRPHRKPADSGDTIKLHERTHSHSK
jgi:hypothetical protein